jgi:plastocyanin
MRRLVLPFLALAVALAIAACSNAASSAPTSAASAPPASAGGGGGGAACAVAPAGGSAAVSVEIKDFKFSPDTVEAKVGDVVGWTNGDSAQHTATLDSGGCSTDRMSQGATGLLVFNQAGTYAYHCEVHPNMKGTVEVK